MTRTLAIAIALSALLLVPACGGGTTTGTTGPTTGNGGGGDEIDDVDRDEGPAPTMPGTPEESLVRLFEDLADDIDGADECGDVADILDEWVEDNTDRYPELNDEAAERDLTDAEIEEFDGRIQDSLVSVVDAIYDCEDDSDVQVAFDRFDELMESI